MPNLPDIMGEYMIIAQSNPRDNTLNERITIAYVKDRRFSIVSARGPTGDWTGSFTVNKDNVSGDGDYQYNKTDHFGKHKFQIDPSNSSIVINGNSGKPKIAPFSFTLKRI